MNANKMDYILKRTGLISALLVAAFVFSAGVASATTESNTSYTQPTSTAAVTVVATKIVCNSETDLPNWNDTFGQTHAHDITSTTAIDFVAANPNCHLAPNWNFQWLYFSNYYENPYGFNIATDYVTTSPYVTFGPTNNAGVASFQMTPDLSKPYEAIYVHELQQPGYTAYSWSETDSVSAEMWCDTDVSTYDPDEVMLSPVAGATYYCVAWNALSAGTPVNTAPVITLIGANPATTTVGSTYTDLGATAQDAEDGDLTTHIVVTGTVDTAVVGTTTLIYTVTDAGGLTATTTRVVEVVECPTEEVVNEAPVITLVGANPATVTVGSTYTDPGATAHDAEDGDITSHIVVAGTVNTTVVGAYTLTYNVADSKGLSAHPVTRTVNVVPEASTPVSPKGSITFCLILANQDNVIATSTFGLPTGSFIIDLASTTNLASSTLESKTWTTSSFAPNRKAILSSNDSDCVTYSDLELGSYYYSELNVSGSLWSQETKYSDQYDQPVNNVFDLYHYSSELFTATSTDDSMRNQNSDGHIVLDDCYKDRIVYILDNYSPAPACSISEITSAKTAQVTVGSAFSYVLTGSGTSTLSVATSTLPAGLSFATSTNTISGTPSVVGTYNITLTSENGCGLDTETLILTVVAAGGIGGGDGSGSGSTGANLAVVKTADKATANPGDTVTYTITVTNNGPETATAVSLSDILSSSLTFVSASTTIGTYSTTTSIWTIGDLANASTSTMTLVATVNAGTAGVKITNIAVASSTKADPDTTNNTSTVDVTVNSPSTGGGNGGNGGGSTGGNGGGNGPIVGSYGNTNTGGNGPIVVSPAPETVPNSCYYLYDYLRKDFNNNPVEVKKLQVFLKNLEGFTSLEVTGIYDDATIAAVNAFQIRYKDDVLLPWGYDGTRGTDYTYILTKKKVNEIYCRMAFPVNAQQQDEIDNYRAFLLGLTAAGIDVNAPQSNPDGKDGPVVTPSGINTVGTAATSSSIGTIAENIGSSTQQLAVSLLSGGKKFMNAALAFLAWPFGTAISNAFDKITGGAFGSGVFGWLNLALILVILLISYLWYREYRNNKTIEDINKEIDLK